MFAVFRTGVGFERHFIERASRGLRADAGVHVLFAKLVKGDKVRERFRARLYAKLRIGVTDGKVLSVHGRHRDGELVGIDLGELGDVLCVLSAIVRLNFVVHTLYQIAKAAKVRHAEVSSHSVLEERRAGACRLRKLFERERAISLRGASVRKHVKHWCETRVIAHESLALEKREESRGRHLARALRREGLEKLPCRGRRPRRGAPHHQRRSERHFDCDCSVCEAGSTWV